MLHMKYLSECESVSDETSYAHFIRLVPANIVKPKPESWGTCLCMPCVNTELKVSAVNKIVPCKLEKLDDVELELICQQLRPVQERIEFLEWKSNKIEKRKEEVENEDDNALLVRKGTTTYHSTKTACSLESAKFIVAFKDEVKEYHKHIERAKSQYRRIREVKNLVIQPDSDAKLLRIDWSENVELYQTIQEKSQYYYSITASVNTAVLYQSSGVQSLATISDVKSHKAEATRASLEAMFKSIGIDFRPLKTLYIVTDSPTSQYRNKKIAYLMSKFASDNGVDVCWIYTEKGHGKGPMDGVGAAVKRVIADTIAYHPTSIIRNTEQLMAVLPEMNVDISTYQDTDVKIYMKQLPRPLSALKLVSDCGFNIGNTHELLISSGDGKSLKVKKISSDEMYGSLHLSMTRKGSKKGKKKVISVEDAGKIERKDEEQRGDSEVDKTDVKEKYQKEQEKSYLVESDSEESDDEESDEADDMSEDDTPEEEIAAGAAQASLDEEQCGKFYCVYFDNHRYWGKLQHVSFIPS